MGYKITSNPWFSILLRLLNSLNRAISRGRSSLYVIFFHICREIFHVERVKRKWKTLYSAIFFETQSISCRRVQGTITITTARNTPWNLPEAHRWHRASPPTDISSLRHNHHHRCCSNRSNYNNTTSGSSNHIINCHFGIMWRSSCISFWWCLSASSLFSGRIAGRSAAISWRVGLCGGCQ